MLKKLLHIVLLMAFSLLLFGCGSNQEKHQKTLEEQLIYSYKLSSQDVREHVRLIVQASEDKKYTLAMNELGKLSATQINNQTQKHAIKLLMEQLRFNLEEEDIARRKNASHNVDATPNS